MGQSWRDRLLRAAKINGAGAVGDATSHQRRDMGGRWGYKTTITHRTNHTLDSLPWKNNSGVCSPTTNPIAGLKSVPPGSRLISASRGSHACWCTPSYARRCIWRAKRESTGGYQVGEGVPALRWATARSRHETSRLWEPLHCFLGIRFWGSLP
jgi:hypothetical protein